MKRIVIPAAIVAVLAVAGTGMAMSSADTGCRYQVECERIPGNIQRLSPEKRIEVRKIIREYAPKLAGVHDRIHVKKMELRALSQNQNATEKTIREVADELRALMDTRLKLEIERRDKLVEVTGFEGFMLRGIEQPGMGPRPGFKKPGTGSWMPPNGGCPYVHKPCPGAAQRNCLPQCGGDAAGQSSTEQSVPAGNSAE